MLELVRGGDLRGVLVPLSRCADLCVSPTRLTAKSERSQVFRAITRAHMLVHAVNERVPGGWFEWMRNTSFKADFDAGEAAKSVDTGAATKAAGRRERPPVVAAETAVAVSAPEAAVATSAPGGGAAKAGDATVWCAAAM